MGPKRMRIASPDVNASNIYTDVCVDWEKCCLCRTGSMNNLRCPAQNSDRKYRLKGYKTLAKNLIQFSALGALPDNLDINSLNEGQGLERTFFLRKAKWHKNCYLKYSSLKLERARAKHKASLEPANLNFEELPQTSTRRPTRRSVPLIHFKEELCFICKKHATLRKPLFKVASLQDEKLRQCANIINNVELKSVLEGGDLIAKEGKYHAKCYTKITNCLRTPTSTIQSDESENYKDSLCHGMAFAIVANFIREKLNISETNGIEYVFRMADLSAMYTKTLASFTESSNSDFSLQHSSRLRDRLLNHFPQLTANTLGRDSVLVRNSANMYGAIYRDNMDDNVIALERVIKTIRSDMSRSKISFNAHLQRDTSCIPPTLLALVNMILYGSSVIKNDNRATEPAVTISQLLLFNFHERMPKGEIVRNNKSHEPPLPIYVGLSIYGKTRSKASVDNLHKMGLSVSSNRVTEITSTLCHLVAERAKVEGVLCPSNLHNGLFTIGAYDNIDHNFSSTTSHGSFHGTGISIFQPRSDGNLGEPRQLCVDVSQVTQRSRKVADLPESFAVVRAVTLPSNQPSIPKCDISVRNALKVNLVQPYWKSEHNWLHHVLESHDNLYTEDVSWAAYHASKHSHAVNTLSLCSLLPLFEEESSSVSMVRHGLDVIRNITNFINTGQVPVMCVDQPLYALAKLVQWNWPQKYGESEFVILFAPFHIEQAFLRVLGQLLLDSGWVSVIANSDVTTEAGADAYLKVTHVTKARHIHQVTACALYILLNEAYKTENTTISFDNWIDEQASQCPTFKFWYMILNLQIILLSFIRSIRQGNYDLFRLCLKNMMPWFFLLDHQHYARWLSIHIKDLEELPQRAPAVHTHFSAGNFVIRKTDNLFSAIAIDQAHEQNNAVVKGDGGAVGLLHDPSMLRRWSVAGPEICSLLNEYDISFEQIKNITHATHHHEQYNSFQKKFMEQVQAITSSFFNFGNPFQESSSDLLALDTRLVAEKDRIDLLYQAENRGVNLYNSFVAERLAEGAPVSVFAPIKKTGTKIFGVTKKRNKPLNMQNLKNDVQLFSRLFIVSRNRNLNLDEFFKFENNPVPPSLSLDGVLRFCQKSQLTHILETMGNKTLFDGTCDAVVYDGAALIHMISPRTSRTFGDYCVEFKKYIIDDVQGLNARRADIVWDTYSNSSTKNAVRIKRGSGIRFQVTSGTVLPKKWSDFLLCDKNKTELFHLVASFLVSESNSFLIVTEVNGKIVSSELSGTLISGVSCRSEEEADGRIFLHVKDCLENDASKIVITTVDTDVLVLAVSYMVDFAILGLRELWVHFGSGKTRRYIAAHEIAQVLGEEKCKALRGFHSFTGCDTVSSFAHKGKTTAWKTWQSFPEATAAFEVLSQPVDCIPTDTFQILERFVIHMYDRCSDLTSINSVRKLLFTAKNRPLENLPPTAAALYQHTLRAAYQAGQVWGKACSKETKIPSPEGWGWTKSGETWTPLWTTQPALWQACRELVKCACTTGCLQRCSCRMAQVPCTLLCSQCATNCSNGRNELDH